MAAAGPTELLTGNDAKSNALIGGINGFNLVAAISAPWFIFPQLGFGGFLAWVGLVWIPTAFSILFFAIPLLRYFGVGHRNRKRQERNLRKILLAQVFQASLAPKGPLWISGEGTVRRAKTLMLPKTTARRRKGRDLTEPNLPPELGWDRDFLRELQALTAEFDGEVEETPEGAALYRFPEILRRFQGAEVVRQHLSLEDQRVGDIIYSSDETSEETDRREVEAFERELERQKELEAYVQDPNRLGYMDDFELVAFDEELKRRRAISA